MRLIGAIFFIAAFVVFAIVRAAARGVATAYHYAFDTPTGMAMKFLGEVEELVKKAFVTHRSRSGSRLSGVIQTLLPEVIHAAKIGGNELDHDTALQLIVYSIEKNDLATKPELQKALDEAHV